MEGKGKGKERRGDPQPVIPGSATAVFKLTSK